MIYEQLVSFETAKLAEEKGFISEIGLGHKRPRGNYYNSDGELNGDCLKLLKAVIAGTGEFDNISAPTQSLLQKWLREVHNINVEVTRFPNIQKWGVLTTNMKIKPKELTSKEMMYLAIDSVIKEKFETYEEALEAGLQKALKRIN